MGIIERTVKKSSIFSYKYEIAELQALMLTVEEHVKMVKMKENSFVSNSSCKDVVRSEEIIGVESVDWSVARSFWRPVRLMDMRVVECNCCDCLLC